MDTLNTELRRKAVSLGLCQMWQDDWQDDKDVAELVYMYKRGLDFCIEHDYPSPKMIRRVLPDLELRRMFHIYADDTGIEDGQENGVYVINGASEGAIKTNLYCALTVHVRHTSNIFLHARDFARVLVHVWDKAQLTVQQSMGAEVTVVKHGRTANVLVVGADNNALIRIKTRST